MKMFDNITKLNSALNPKRKCFISMYPTYIKTIMKGAKPGDNPTYI